MEPQHTNIALKREGKVLPRDFTTASRAALFKMFKDKQWQESTWLGEQFQPTTQQKQQKHVQTHVQNGRMSVFSD